MSTDHEHATHLIAAAARLEAIAEAQNGAIQELSRQVAELAEHFAAQQARVQEFWLRGKGAEWDSDIKANTAAIKLLTDRISKAETDNRVTKAKAVGLLAGAGAAGGGIVKALGGLFGQ